MTTQNLGLSIRGIIDNIESKDRAESRLLSPTEVAEELNLHINTIYKIIQRGHLTVYNLSVEGGRDKYFRIRRDDLESYLESRRVREVQSLER
jgi:excisionase family DNA binding protein